MTTLAAIDAAHLVMEDGWRPTDDFLPITTADKLFGIMDDFGIHVLHVHLTALERIGLPGELADPPRGERRPDHPFVADVTHRGERINQRALSPSIRCGSREILIGAYQGHGDGDPFADAANARDLLDAHIAFREAFATERHPAGFAFKHSALTTGSQLMHAPWRKRRGAPDLHKSYVIPQLGDLPRGIQVERPYIWTRSPTYESSHQYVAAWDVNWQRLSACSGLSLGIEGIEERSGTEFDKRLPGYHLIPPSPDVGGLPPTMPPIFAPGWHATPIVAMAIECGILDAPILRSIVWTDHKRYLEPFYETMRDARQKLLDSIAASSSFPPPPTAAAPLALAALKPCYLQPFGRMRSIKARDEQSIYYRPHWYDSIISNELARQYRVMHALALAGVPILAVYFDTIIIETDIDNPLNAPDPITVSPQLGKFKPVGSMETSVARRLLYAGERPKPGQLVKVLKLT